MVRAIDAFAREAPEDLDRKRPGCLAHRDVRAGVANDDAVFRRTSQTSHRVDREIRRRLRSWHRVATKVDVDLARDTEATEDALAVRRALARHGRLKEPGFVER